jgi:hypothetical protein
MSGGIGNDTVKVVAAGDVATGESIDGVSGTDKISEESVGTTMFAAGITISTIDTIEGVDGANI